MKEIAIDNPELQFLSCLTGACVGEAGADCPLRKALNLYRDESKKRGA